MKRPPHIGDPVIEAEPNTDRTDDLTIQSKRPRRSNRPVCEYLSGEELLRVRLLIRIRRANQIATPLFVVCVNEYIVSILKAERPEYETRRKQLSREKGCRHRCLAERRSSAAAPPFEARRTESIQDVWVSGMQKVALKYASGLLDYAAGRSVVRQREGYKILRLEL
jgi:hypothetical protein